MITPEILEAILGGSDISEMEDQRTLMMKMGQGLRGYGAGARGKDVGSNIARAAAGIGGALGDYKAASASPDITKAKQDLFARLLRRKQQAPVGPSYFDENQEF